jgi:glycosyltransferase involved in cell wall biosynthesis
VRSRRVLLLSANLGSNNMGRIWLLWRLLRSAFEVRVAGFLQKGKIVWAPVRDQGMPITRWEWPSQWRALLDGARSSDIIYAQKPLMTSFGLGLALAHIIRKPVALDIDDWESGLLRDRLGNRSLKGVLAEMVGGPGRQAGLGLLLLDNLTWMAKALTVSNTFLQRRYGGTLIWHTREPSEYEPSRFDICRLKHRYGIPDHFKTVGFVGTIRKHKGIERMVQLVETVTGTYLVIAGIPAEERAAISRTCAARIPGRFLILGPQQIQALPETMSLVDIYLIPQTPSWSSMGQVPAKLFDAMAMGKVIIASDATCDVQAILGDTGYVYRENDNGSLMRAADQIMGDWERARRRGQSARNRLIELYGFRTAQVRLTSLLADL